MLAALTERANDASTAVVDIGPQGRRNLRERDPDLGRAEPAGQRHRDPPTRPGCAPGRPCEPDGAPGARLTTLIYACMKLGAVIVVAGYRPGSAGPDSRFEGR